MYKGMGKMIIPKYPKVPNLTDTQIEEMTKIVFCEEGKITKSDIIFVFGTTQPGCYLKTIEAYNKGLGKEIIISGGVSISPNKHKDWADKNEPEADGVFKKLVENGVPAEIITLENKSTNSKENILFTKDIYDFSKVNRMVFISKNYAAGRQYRTLKKYLSKNISMCSFGYNIYFDDGTTFDRYDWMNNDKARSLVFGEYLRIVYYGNIGEIENIDKPIEGLEKSLYNL